MSIVWEAQDLIEPIADSTIEAIANMGNYGVISGTAPTYSAVSMEKTIAEGIVLHNGAGVAVTGNNVTLVSDPSNPRWTWTGINSSGVAVIVSGDPAAEPSVPELGDNVSNSLDLIQAAQTLANNITYKLDKRVMTGGINAWTHLDTQVLTDTATAVTFSSLSTAFRAFRLTINAYASGTATLRFQLNNDSGANYATQTLLQTSTTVTGATSGTTSSGELLTFTNTGNVEAAGCELLIWKQLATEGATFHSRGYSFGGSTRQWLTGGSWNNTTDLISRIDVIISAGNLAAGTRVTLEGLAQP